MFTNAELSERYRVRDWDEYFDHLAAEVDAGRRIYFEGHAPTPAAGECVDGIMIYRSGRIARFKSLGPVEIDVDDIALEVANDTGDVAAPLVGELPEPDAALRLTYRDDDAHTLAPASGRATFSYMATKDTWHAHRHIAERVATWLGMAGKVDLFGFHEPWDAQLKRLEARLAAGGSVTDEEPPVRVRFLLAPEVPVLTASREV